MTYKKLVRDLDPIDAGELGYARDRSRHQQERGLSELSGCMRVIKPMLTDTQLLSRVPKHPPPTGALRAEISIEGDPHETLADLLKRAGVALETDLHAAKICIERLAALLEIKLSPESPASAEHSGPRGGLAPWQAKRVRSYIEENLGSNMRATNLAAIVQLGTSQLFRTFRKTFGEAPHAYIMRRRILRAQERMSSSHAPMVQIALECGMCDQSHFIRVFRRIVGVNSTAWRRQILRNRPSYSAAPEFGIEIGSDTCGINRGKSI